MDCVFSHQEFKFGRERNFWKAGEIFSAGLKDVLHEFCPSLSFLLMYIAGIE